jgi:tryptophanase
MAMHEPHKIKTVRLLSFPSVEERKHHLAGAHFNVFNLTPSQVVFDMCSLGTSAVSQEQLAGQLIGDEAYAGSRNFEALEEAVHQVLGHSYVCPTHNVLGCVKLVVSTMIPRGSVVPSNARTRLDTLQPLGVEYPHVRNVQESVFTGNMDLAALESALDGGKVAVVGMQAFADGQHPFSLENLRAVRALADRYGKRLVLDGSRIIENAWYIQRHEPGQADRSIAEIVRQIVKTTHVFQLDGAQDPKCNTGGILTTDNPDDHEKWKRRSTGSCTRRSGSRSTCVTPGFRWSAAATGRTSRPRTSSRTCGSITRIPSLRRCISSPGSALSHRDWPAATRWCRSRSHGSP